MKNIIYASDLIWNSCECLEPELYSYRLKGSKELHLDVDMETGSGFLWSDQVEGFGVCVSITPESITILKNAIEGGRTFEGNG